MFLRTVTTAFAVLTMLFAGAVGLSGTAAAARGGDGGGGTSRSCLTGAARALLNSIESRFGAMRIVSTCRPGATIAGSGRVSKHASGNAIDFDAGNRKGEVVRWLVANHGSGGTMTYADMSHIHVDIGPHFVSLASGSRVASNEGGSSRRSSRSRSRDDDASDDDSPRRRSRTISRSDDDDQPSRSRGSRQAMAGYMGLGARNMLDGK